MRQNVSFIKRQNTHFSFISINRVKVDEWLINFMCRKGEGRKKVIPDKLAKRAGLRDHTFLDHTESLLINLLAEW